jgi:hypothetical protein
MISLFSGLFMLFMIFVVGILGTIFWFWMLIDCATNEPSQGNDKLVWIVIILFTHFVGAGIYFFFRRPQRRAECGR